MVQLMGFEDEAASDESEEYHPEEDNEVRKAMAYDNKGNMIKTILIQRGSVFKKSAIPAMIAAIIAFLLYALKKTILSLDENVDGGLPWYIKDLADDRFNSPFPVQISAFIVAFTIVSRVSIAMDRYNEGYSNIQFMASKWADAFMQLVAFTFEEIGRNPAKEEELRLFLMDVMHKFSLMSAMCFTTLSGEEADPSTFPVKVVRWKVPEEGDEDFVDATWKVQVSSALPARNTRIGTMKAHRMSAGIVDLGLESRAKKYAIFGGISPEEDRKLCSFPDMLQGVLFWIIEDVTRVVLMTGEVWYCPKDYLFRAFFAEHFRISSKFLKLFCNL